MEKSQVIQIGDTISHLERELGRPISIYKFALRDGKRLLPAEVVDWNDVLVGSWDEDFKLYYTEQIDHTKDYYHFHVVIRANFVVEKSSQRIRE